MHIYPQEIKDGLEAQLKASARLAISCPILLSDKIVEVSSEFINKAFAKHNYKPAPDELFYFENILATVGWNLNDDVFDAQEMYDARLTPIHKPLNIEHMDRNIIGHTISAVAVNEDYSPVNDFSDGDDIGEFRHIMCGDVIYKMWHDDEMEASIAKIIDEIRNGEWSVSMEAIMKGFDYALRDKDGNAMIVERNAANANMTKNLKLFGGSGEYEGYRIGRLMRKFKFSAKGIVKVPANPYSIIFNNFNSSSAKYVYSLDDIFIFHGDNNMSDEIKALQSENKQYRDENLTLAKANATVEVKLASATEKVTALEAKLTDLTDSNKTLAADLTASKAKVVELEAEVAKQSKLAKDAEEARVSALDKAAKAEVAVKLQDRKTKLTSALVDKKIEDAANLAIAYVEKHADKSDDVYSELATMYAASLQPKPEADKPAPKTSLASLLESPTVKTVEDPAKTLEIEDEMDSDAFEALATALYTNIQPRKGANKFQLKETK
jgi:hypothetical protein